MHILNRFSLRQMCLLVALVAITITLGGLVPAERRAVSALLAAPLLAYLALRVAGIALRPAKLMSGQPAYVLGTMTLLCLLALCFFSPWFMVTLLPVTALWIPQIVLVERVEARLERKPVVPPAVRAEPRRGRWFLAIVAGMLVVGLLTSGIYGALYYAVGKGPSLGMYWMVVHSGGVIEYQWLYGYSDIPWHWLSAPRRMTPAAKHRDWQFLGLARYRVGSIEKLRVPLWLPIGLCLIVPAVWLPRELLSLLKRT